MVCLVRILVTWPESQSDSMAMMDCVYSSTLLGLMMQEGTENHQDQAWK